LAEPGKLKRVTKAKPAPPPNQSATFAGQDGRVIRLVKMARLALLWEMVWLGLWRVATALGLFLGLSLFDVWRLVPAYVHWTAVLALLCFGGFSLFQERGNLRLPSRRAILARIERDNGLPHHPLRALEDRPELGGQNPEAELLWQRHLVRVRQALPHLRFVWPRPRAIVGDPHGLRLMAGILLLAGFVAAGPQWWPRIKAGFSPEGLGQAGSVSRLEGWITPPAYTGVAPVMLAGSMTSATLPSPGGAVRPGTPVSVPVGSELTVRLFGGREPELRLIPETGPKQRLALTKIDSANSHATVKLQHSLRLQLRQSGADSQEWPITVIPDLPPLISLLEDISVTKQYGLRIKYGASDDYGVVGAAAEITLVTDNVTDNVTDKSAAAPPPLRVAFPAPLNAAKNGQVAYADLAAHPWAGRLVRLRLVATDAAGQTGLSPVVELVLPQRRFANPLARAVIEQRRHVALDASKDDHVIRALDALSLYPEKFLPDLKIYLALRTARHGLQHVHNSAAARDQIGDTLWRLALQIEDGDLSLANSELRALQKALMQALKDGASDEEIANLTQALREALERYLQAMGEQAMDDEMPMTGAPPNNSGVINKSDLDKLLDQIEKLSKSGAREAAQEMLSRLQNILENMRPGTTGGGQTAAQKLYGESLQDLSQMMREQQQLQDQTHQQQQQQQQGGGQGKGGLARTQDKLGGALGELMDKMGQAMQQDAPNALGRAERAMRNAAKALRQGESGAAIEQQGQAMSQLRAGADALTKLLREEDARAQAQNDGGDENSSSDQGTDPLGRPMANDSGGGAAIPKQFDIERALQIRRELEQRASQRRRPSDELKYIDRLLKLF
jgi:uncharacterized protein (TIGR02302 family)